MYDELEPGVVVSSSEPDVVVLEQLWFSRPRSESRGRIEPCENARPRVSAKRGRDVSQRQQCAPLAACSGHASRVGFTHRVALCVVLHRAAEVLHRSITSPRASRLAAQLEWVLEVGRAESQLLSHAQSATRDA